MSTLVSLPEGAIEEILLRLPIKSLQRFKCVAKSWYARISDPSFLFNHFITSNNHEFVDFLLINQIHPVKIQVLSFLSSEALEIKTKHFQLSYHASSLDDETISFAQLLGPCNGIICLYDSPTSTISLWNPANQQLKTLPKCNVNPPPNASSYEEIIGFGFDNVSNDYKVLAYNHMRSPPSSRTTTVAHAELYTLSRNTWKEINVGEEFQPIGRRPNPHSSPSVNGVFSWLETDKQSNQKVIFSFNMNTEVFIKTQLPNRSNQECLASHKDSLAIIQNDYSCGAGVYYDIWVLGEYGVRESWVKQLTIGPIFGLTSALGFWKNGELLLDYFERQKLVSYDPVTKDMKDLPVLDVFVIWEVLPYKKNPVCFMEDIEQETDQTREMNPLSVTEYQEEELL